MKKNRTGKRRLPQKHRRKGFFRRRGQTLGLALLMLLAALLAALLLCPVCFAEETEELYEEQRKASGADALPDALPEETRQLLEQWGSETIERDAVFSLSPQEVLNTVGQLLRQNSTEPLRAAAVLIGIFLLCALLQGAGGALGETEGVRVFRIVVILAAALLLLPPVLSLLRESETLLQAASVFQGAFVPVFAGVVAANGQAATAGAYAALTVTAAEGASVLFSSVLLPILSFFLALSAVFTATRQQTLSSAGMWLQKSVKWVLGFTMSIFLGILALQTTVGAAADGASAKAVRFVVSSTVPVVGGALNEALNTVRGCLGILKSTVGAFGILAGAALFLPLLAKIVLWNIAILFCAAVGDLLEQKEIGEFLRAVSTVLGLAAAMLLCCAAFLILSVGMLIAAKNSG